MATASAVGDGGDIALAQGSEICFDRSSGPSRPGAFPSRLAHNRSRPAHRAAWTRRPLAPRSPVAEANDVTADQHAGRAAGSSGEPFQNSRIGAHDPAGPVRAPGGSSAGSFNGSLLRKSRRQITRPRPQGHGPATGACRTYRAAAANAKRCWRRLQAGDASQAEWAIDSGRRVEEALIGRLGSNGSGPPTNSFALMRFPEPAIGHRLSSSRSWRRRAG